MNFIPLNESLYEQAVELAVSLYKNEANACPLLPSAQSAEFVSVCREQAEKDIKELCSSADGSALAAVTDNGILAGYLAFPAVDIEGFFGVCYGAYSPLSANAFRDTQNEPGGMDCRKAASMLFQKVSALINEKRQNPITSFALTVFAHNSEVISSFVLNGFGIRCTDAIKRVENPIPYKNCTVQKDITLKTVDASLVISTCDRLLDATAELPSTELTLLTEGLYSLWSALGDHLEESPIFFSRWPPSFERFRNSLADHADSKFFLALDSGGTPAGFIQLQKEGENWISDSLCVKQKMAHICGTYVTPGYRADNGCVSVASILLKYIEETLYAEGIPYLGVDCETLNPTALRFWGKYFGTYTYSLHRRIDERCFYNG